MKKTLNSAVSYLKRPRSGKQSVTIVEPPQSVPEIALNETEPIEIGVSSIAMDSLN